MQSPDELPVVALIAGILLAPGWRDIADKAWTTHSINTAVDDAEEILESARNVLEHGSRRLKERE